MDIKEIEDSGLALIRWLESQQINKEDSMHLMVTMLGFMLSELPAENKQEALDFTCNHLRKLAAGPVTKEGTAQ